MSAHQQALFLFLLNGGMADIKVKCRWGWVILKSAEIESVGRQYFLGDGTIETNIFVHREYAIVHYEDDREEKIAWDFPSRFVLENVLESENHHARPKNDRANQITPQRRGIDRVPGV